MLERSYMKLNKILDNPQKYPRITNYLNLGVSMLSNEPQELKNKTHLYFSLCYQNQMLYKQKRLILQKLNFK